MTRKSILDLPMASIERDIAALSHPAKHEPPRITAQTTTQRTAAHRRRGKELVERLTRALTEIAEADPAWVSDNPEWAIEIAQKAIKK